MNTITEAELIEARSRNAARHKGLRRKKRNVAKWETEISDAQIARAAGRINRRLARAATEAVPLNERLYTHFTGSKKAFKQYGLDENGWLALLEKHDSKCAICGRKEKFVNSLAIDHCHQTGRVRGLLCRRCNTALGQFKDSPELLSKALQYLADS